MLDFVTTIMEDFSDSNTQFALMQYSKEFETHFDFMNFSKIRDPKSLTSGITHQQGKATRTCTAILEAIKELFDPRRGTRKNVKKLLIIITDGESRMDNTPSSESTREANRIGVRRFAIGVGNVFSLPMAYNELKSIASSEPEDHVFKVTNFSALENFHKMLEDKIFTIEGLQSLSGDNFQMEVSQEGFSALLTPDGVILGAVGAHNWAGGAYSYRTGKEKASWINTPEDGTDMKDSYMGYAMQLVDENLIAMGAPRFQHLGRVLIYRRNPNTFIWHQVATVTGKQIGSYFGSVLCSLLVNSSFSLLLVGAPTHFSADSPGGLVFLCPITRVVDSPVPVTFTCLWTLHGDRSQVVGHFGSAISVLPDLTGDGFSDLAVGAPCEDNNRGSVYIFPGQDGGFKASYVQRISGQQVSRMMKYFGRSITGSVDMTGDNLPDLIVGGEGQVLILRSRPVLDISVSIMFDPSEISRSLYECADDFHRHGPVTTITVCFTVHLKSKEVSGEDFGRLTYNVLLDTGRINTRALFSSGGRSIKETLTLNDNHNCWHHFVELLECVEDSFTPLRATLNYSLIGNPVLSEDSQSTLIREILFENCGRDGECKDDLRVNLTFTNLTQLVVGLFHDVNVTVLVKNLGDDSYNTRVLISFPHGLSYRRVTLTESNKHVTITCSTLKNERVVNCGVNQPLLKPNTTAVFLVSFYVAPMADLGETLTIRANVSSDNGGPSNQLMASSRVRVLYSVYVVINRQENTSKHQNFSSSDHSISHVYRVINLGQRQLPVSIIFLVPLQLGNTSVWEKPNITSTQPESTTCTTNLEEPTGAENFKELLKRNLVFNCSVGVCQRMACDIRYLEKGTPVTFTISGRVTADWSTQTGLQRVSLQTVAEVVYDRRLFQHVLEQERPFTRAQAQTTLEIPPEYNYYPLIIGSSVGGLLLLAIITAGLHKLGFFRRQYKELLEGPGEERAVMSEAQGAEPAEAQGAEPAGAELRRADDTEMVPIQNLY
ncbi:integrin alpha-M-like isoform X1 [Phyllobates terribilis]